MKKSMTWVDIAVWMQENAGGIARGYIDNVYGDEDQMILRIRRSSGEPLNLVIAPEEAIYITSRSIEKRGEELGHVAMLFRKYLRDMAVKGVFQKPCERIVEIIVARGGEEYRLIVELIPRGLIALVDSDGIVKALNRRLVARDREVRIGGRYQYPPSLPSICTQDPSKLVEGVMRGYDIVRGIITGANIPPDVAEEIIYRLGIRKDARPADLGVTSVREIIEGVIGFIEDVKKSPNPGIILDHSGSPYGFYPFEPRHLISAGYTFKRLSSFNEAIDLFYAHAKALMKKEKPPELLRIEKGIEKLRSQIAEASERLKTMEKILEYVNQNYQQLEELFECVRKRLGSCAEAPDDVIRVRGDTLEIEVGGLKYRFDPRLSFMENYIQIRKKVAELEKRISRGSEEVARLEEEARRIYAEIERRRAVEAIRSLRRREWFERYHWIITSEGLLAIGGMDADQNERIVKKYLRDDYIFLHADIQGGSAVILFTDKEYTNRSIEEAARIAACYSRAWQAGYGSIDVFYVKGSQVSKSPPPGQYLEKGSFMIYGERGWIRGVPLELAIGIQPIEETIPRIIVGPPELVSSRAVIWSILIPGDVGRREAAEYIHRRWVESGRVRREVVEAIDVDEIARRLPGRVRIASSRV
ncbi:MAG: ribosome rescue protein RqcH [Sulfolobales archaeon]